MIGNISFAMIGDAPGIVQLIRSSFTPEILDRTIYGCTGADRYVANHLAASRLNDTVYVAVKEQGVLIGCAEFRRLPDALWLSYIATAANYRGRGVARAMLKWAIEHLKTPARTVKLFLDVFQFNTAAKAWYERLGLEERAVTNWYDLAQSAEPGYDACLGGMAQSEEIHHLFGFSQFRMITGTGRYEIGRIHSRWFRITESQALVDDQCLKALAALDRSRDLLVQVPSGTEAEKLRNLKPAVTSINMVANIDRIRKQLG